MTHSVSDKDYHITNGHVMRIFAWNDGKSGGRFRKNKDSNLQKMATERGVALVAFIALVCLFVTVSSDLYVNQPGYIYYKQPQKTSQYNVFEITFKTIDATGMLLHAQSVEKGDFLTLELVRGKIRYAGEFGNGHINIDKQVTGYHNMYVGQDLADNQWHTVKVTQNTQDITIIIDGRREPRYFGFWRAPPAPTQFSVEEVFIGGLYSYVGVSEERSVAQEGDSMCVRSAYMNGIDLLNQGTRKNVQSFCDSINYYPIFFPNKVSHLSYKNYDIKSLRLKFDFRTVIPDQVVANYTNKLTKVLDLTLDRQGRLVLGATVEKTGSHLVMKTGKPNLHDGTWHTVELFLSNREPNYDAEFIVDGVKRRSKFLNPFIFDGGPLHFGFGFTGCMKNLLLNGRAVDYTQMQKVSVIMGKCNLKDFCTPNPCINGARFNYTCTEIHEKAGDRFISDKYWLDMDGIGGLDPVRAFCRKGRTPQDTITQINTTIPFDINVINPTGKKIIPVTYLADEESLRELLLHFKSCRQFIRYRCARSALFKSPTGPKQVQWMGFDDKLHYYWGGSGGRRGYCACGLTRTCIDKEMHCNCDAFKFVRDIEDKGYLTTKEHLPVRRIDYFDVMSDTGKNGISSIGALECWGVDTSNLAATFREQWSYMQIELTDENEWNNHIDAGDVALEFLTTTAAGTLVFARGPISGDFLEIKLINRQRARATMNLGYYKNMHLDVDIAVLNRTFDDNLPHKLRLDWNRREMNFTVDNITRIVEFHYQYGITHLDVDGSPFYVGGRNDGLGEGFIGIIRSFYYGGKLVDLPTEAEGLSRIGVYPGQGSACKLVKSPCNQGFCIEEYNKYFCNCSVSAFSGNHCQYDQNAFVFTSGKFLRYTFQKKVQVQEGYINVAFKTNEANAVISQLRGDGNAHITLLLINGVLKLLFNFRPLETDLQSLDIQHPQQTTLGKFNDNKRHIIRIHHKENQIFTYVLDNSDSPIKGVRNISAPFTTMLFPEPATLALGRRSSLLVGFPTTFVGCITGLRYQYLPQGAKIGVNIDMGHLFQTKNPSLDRSQAPVNGSCGDTLPVPPALPPIIPPQQFKFRNPVVTVAPIGSNYTFGKAVVIGIVCVLIVLAVVLLFITLKCVENYKKKYRAIEEKLALTLHEKAPAKEEPPTRRNDFYYEREQEPEIPLQELRSQPAEPVYPSQSSYGPETISYAPSPKPGAAAASPPEKDDDDGFFL
eukprot:gene14177-5183_t